MSEESRRHLENLFVVQHSGAAGPSSSLRPPSYANGGCANGGYTSNNGYMKSENGYNPALEETFTVSIFSFFLSRRHKIVWTNGLCGPLVERRGGLIR